MRALQSNSWRCSSTARSSGSGGCRNAWTARQQQQQRARRNTRAVVVVRAASQQQQLEQQQPQQPLRALGPEAALVLAWHAAKNRSLFAAQCFAEAVLEAYRRGVTVDELELGLQLRQLEAPAGAPGALGAQEVDLIVTWVLVVMLTAQELGLPFGGGGGGSSGSSTSTSTSSSKEEGKGEGEGDAAGGITARHGPQSLGLRGYVRQTLARYDSEGATLARVTALQAAVRAQGSEDGGVSQAAEVMQAYARLALLTVEAAAAAAEAGGSGGGGSLNRAVLEPRVVTAPTGFARALLGPPLQAGGGGESSSSTSSSTSSSGGGGGESSTAAAATRELAVHLLASFIGAVLGSPFCFEQFVAAAGDAYALGLPARSVVDALAEAEFAQSGGLLPVAAPRRGAPAVTRQLFARWLSTAYFAFADSGAVFPPAAAGAAPAGWAWAGGGASGGGAMDSAGSEADGEVEANALAAFVGATLARADADEAEAAAAGAAADRPVEADGLAARIRSNPEAAAQLEAASKAASEELSARGTLRGRPAPAMVKVADDEFAATSSALVAMRQQAALVLGARALVRAVAARQRREQGQEQGGQPQGEELE